MTAPGREPPAGEVLLIDDGTPSARDALWRAGLLAGSQADVLVIPAAAAQAA